MDPSIWKHVPIQRTGQDRQQTWRPLGLRCVPADGPLRKSMNKGAGMITARCLVVAAILESTRGREVVQFRWFGYSVVIRINPDQERVVDPVAGVNHAIAVAPVLGVVINGEGDVAVRMRRRWLWCG